MLSVTPPPPALQNSAIKQITDKVDLINFNSLVTKVDDKANVIDYDSLTEKVIPNEYWINFNNLGGNIYYKTFKLSLTAAPLAGGGVGASTTFSANGAKYLIDYRGTCLQSGGATVTVPYTIILNSSTESNFLYLAHNNVFHLKFFTNDMGFNGVILNYKFTVFYVKV